MQPCILRDRTGHNRFYLAQPQTFTKLINQRSLKASPWKDMNFAKRMKLGLHLVWRKFK